MTKERKILAGEQAEKLADEFRTKGKSVGMCHGVFDLLHPGHFAHFRTAKTHVDVLFVSVTADQFVNKGPGRPLFSDIVRAETISALEYVDYVLISNNETAVQSIDQIKPNLYFKGSDYSNFEDDITGMINLEVSQVEKYGGAIKFTDELTSSSTSLINNFFSNHSQELDQWLKSLRKRITAEEVFSYLDLVSETRVGLIGEIIIDEYTMCEPLAKSSKDPILAFQVNETTTFLGGILAIGENLGNWTEDVSLISTLPETIPQGQKQIVEDILNMKNLQAIHTPSKLITKHRFVDTGSKSRVFETYDFDQNEVNCDPKLLSLIKEISPKIEVCIVADYGHGLISKELAKEISSLKNFLAVNTQANAGNRGYNTITKYSRADFLSLNGGELQLELRDRNPIYENIVPEYMKRMNAKYAIVTLGARGMMVFSEGKHTSIPALGNRVVDKVGAGDSVLAIGSLLARHSTPIEIIGLLSSIVAAHEIGQLGHRSSMRIADIKKAVKGLLG